MAKSWWNSAWICWKSLKLTEIWISNWTGDFCAAIKFSKKFKVLLGFDVARLGSLNQRQLENLKLTSKISIFFPRMDRSLHWPRRIWISNWIFGAEKSFAEVWKCGILNLLITYWFTYIHSFKLESNDKNTWFCQHFLNIFSKFCQYSFFQGKIFQSFFSAEGDKKLCSRCICRFVVFYRFD